MCFFTIGKDEVLDGGDTLRQDQRSQRVAFLKSAVIDRADTVGKVDGSQRSASIEGVDADYFHAVRKRDRGQSGTILKYKPRDISQA